MTDKQLTDLRANLRDRSRASDDRNDRNNNRNDNDSQNNGQARQWRQYGPDTTLTALQNAADIRWTNTTNEATGSTNNAGTNDTVIYWKNNTVTTSDDVIVMVLEDYTTALTMTDFEIV